MIHREPVEERGVHAEDGDLSGIYWPDRLLRGGGPNLAIPIISTFSDKFLNLSHISDEVFKILTLL